MLRFHRTMIYLTFVFFYEYARGRYALNGHVTFLRPRLSCIPYHVPPAWVLVCFPSHFMCFSYLYKYGLTTRPRWLVCLMLLFMFCRLVHLRFSLMPFPFCLDDSSVDSLFLELWLILWLVHPHTARLSRYICMYLYLACLVLSLYNGLEMWACPPSSIYFATTLKVWPARSHVLSSSSLARWPRLLASRSLGVRLLCLLAYQ